MSTGFKLVVLQEGRLVQEHKLNGGPVIVGRETGNTLVINHPQVSRRHIQLNYNGQSWVLENLSQANPATIQGFPVNAPVLLRPDEPIQLGTGVVVIMVADSEVAAPGSLLNGVVAPVPNYPVANTQNAFVAPAAPQIAQSFQNNVEGTVIIDSKPPKLRVTYTDNNREFVKEYALIQPQISLGRAPENDISIPIATVSRNHAVLKAGPHGYTINDLGSSNGLTYSGQRFQERNLVDGDVIRIVDSLGNYTTLVYEDSSRPVVSQNVALQIDPRVQIITIGRAPDNFMRLDYPQVSAHHAVIRRQSNGAVLEDLGSSNGTFVRGQRVSPHHPVNVNPGDSIQIASYQLTYQQSSIAQGVADKVRIDALHLRKAVNNNSLVLLNDISLTIQPKEFIALVGGSGAGKSTLLDALNGFRPASDGTVLFNGEDYYRNFAIYRTSLGYVPQDDIIHRELPVDRALYYVAKLRLPEDTSDAEIEQRVVEVLADVDMTERRAVPVSKLSGGQRKRTSIAVELLAKPNLLFLDEPTSGLDPGLDKRLMYLLRRLADQGRTVVLVTHATTNINVCDKVVFLGRGGKLCFFGSPQAALEFFEVREFPDIYTKLEETPTSADEWEARFRQSPYFQESVVKPQNNIPVPARPVPYGGGYGGPGYPPPPPTQPPLRSPTTSAINQFMILTQRYAELVIRDRINLLFLILQAPIIGIILGLVAGRGVFEFGPDHPAALAQQVSFMLAMSGVWLGTINAAREITKENAIYLRERLVNLGVLPYIASKVFVLATLSLIQSILLILIVAVLSGVPPNGAIFPSFLELIFSLWLTTLVGIGMGLLVSALASNTDKAVSIIPIILIPQIILSGAIFNLSGPTKAFSYVTITKWSLDSLGTSADLNRIFLNNLGQEDRFRFVAANCPYSGVFDGKDYADDACSPNNDGTFGNRAIHLFIRWTIMILMTALFLYLTCYMQKRKDNVSLRR